jgi:predicted DNA-binding transcriptional regulator AlpA
MSEERRSYAPDYVSAETLAYRLDCSRSTIDVYVKAGLLPKPVTVGNLVRWDFAIVRAYIMAQNVPMASVEDAYMDAVNGQAKKA